jgi:hypothetical protein
MKFVIGSIFGVFVMCSTSAWVFPTRTDLQKAASIASMATAIASAPLVAQAVDFTGSYIDPNHPNCQRIISPAKASKSAVVLTGTDGNPGCPPDGSGTTWQLMGEVKGSNIFVDFTPKGGPKDLKGVYDATGRAIVWPDGNSWKLKS